jgi:2'-hydroxyisoflavone reductase
MRLLVLGGTRFAGRAVVEAALADGIDVTALNRGVSGGTPDGVTGIAADRTNPDELRKAIGDGEWDAVIDTWSGAPRVLATSCAMLAGRTGHFGYVSTVSVYRWPIPAHADERTPVVDGDPDGGDLAGDLSNYPAVKRGSELAALRAFGAQALLARPGLILGPHENVGRLPWWLRRIERGGRVLAPGKPERPVQYIDARDLARWMLDAARQRRGGVFNVVCQPGHATMGRILDTAVRVTGSGAELVWTPDRFVLDAGIMPWTELPLWLPDDPEYAGLDTTNVDAAHAAGLGCRPVEATVADTWAWLRADGDPAPRPGQPSIGLDPARERQVLDAVQQGRSE